MAVGERHTQKHRRKMPSFSSSLLDAIYHSIDDPREINEPKEVIHRIKNATQEIESLRRAIRIEKWLETTPMHLSSNSTDSSTFSPESSALARSSVLPKHAQQQLENTPKRQGRFTRTKSRALKIYGDLKKVKEPTSPGGKIVNFFNSIFSPRNLKKNNQVLEQWSSSVRKSRSMKDPSSSSRSCLSKRTVRFCPVSVILDEDSQPCGHKKTIYVYDKDEYSVSASLPKNIGSRFIKKNMDSLTRDCEDEVVVDDKSCASSDLFELENIGRVGAFEEELPVYGTTSVKKMNQAIASGLIM